MTPRFDTNLIFTTVDALIRSTQPASATPAMVSAADPLKVYLPMPVLLSVLTESIKDMRVNMRKAVRAGLLQAEDVEPVQHEIERRVAYVKQLRASKETTLYVALYPQSETEADADAAGPSWN